ncbi:MAG: putative selenate ABC transporter substrate-binding protein [SAR324 cluster bacterium]|nr:putative selenate ABC transporter substrate-binding protein [SAR324 cluster bacterium]
MKKWISGCFAIILFSTLAQAQTLSFTAIPDQNTARLEQRFGKVAQYLADILKIDVKYIPVKSYSASVNAFKNDQVQLAWFGGLSGVQARRAVAGSQAIAQGEEDQYFVTYLIAHASTGLQRSDAFPKSIAGKTFTFGSKGSTSGRLMPEYYIRQSFDQAPKSIFKRVGFSGDHSKTIALVQSGSYQVGAVNFKVWERELKEGKIDTSQVQVIWKTPTYVDYNWTVRGDVDKKFGKGFTRKLQNALITMHDKTLLDSFPRKQFIKADNSMYAPILETAMNIGIIEK